MEKTILPSCLKKCLADSSRNLRQQNAVSGDHTRVRFGPPSPKCCWIFNYSRFFWFGVFVWWVFFVWFPPHLPRPSG